jgi:hypothetical protein
MQRNVRSESASAIVEASLRVVRAALRGRAEAERAGQRARDAWAWGAEVRSATAVTRLEAQHIRASSRSRRLARWTSDDDSRRSPLSLRPAAAAARVPDRDPGMVPQPAETVALWCDRAKSMGRDELVDFERRTFAAWDRDSVSNDSGDRDDQFDARKSIGFGPVPPELMERWVGAVRAMDAHVLEALVRHTRRHWSPAELAPLEVAVAARHRVFEQRAAIADATRHAPRDDAAWLCFRPKVVG